MLSVLLPWDIITTPLPNFHTLILIISELSCTVIVKKLLYTDSVSNKKLFIFVCWPSRLELFYNFHFGCNIFLYGVVFSSVQDCLSFCQTFAIFDILIILQVSLYDNILAHVWHNVLYLIIYLSPILLLYSSTIWNVNCYLLSKYKKLTTTNILISTGIFSFIVAPVYSRM